MLFVKSRSVGGFRGIADIDLALLYTLLDMFDLSWGDTRRGQGVFMANNTQCNEGFHFTEPWPAMERRTTVRDLLKMKRQDEMFLKWKLRQEENMTGHKVRRCDSYTSAHSPEQMDTGSPMNLATTPKNDHFCWKRRYQHEDNMFEHEVNMGPPDNSPEHMDTISSVNLTASPVRTQSPTQMDLSPTRAPADPTAMNPAHFPPAHPASYMAAPQQHPSPQAPAMTLFHWQVQQQLSKMRGLSAELVNMQDPDGDTYLHIAVAQGKRALAYILAANMAVNGTLDITEHNGQTALHIAVATNQHLIVSDLLEYGAQMNTRDAWGRTPLHVCVEKGHVRSLLSIFKTLKAQDKEFDVDIVNYDGLTSLHVAILSHNAIIREVASLEKSGLFKETEVLLKKGQMFFECIKILLQMGASFGAKDQKSGRTGLHMAAEKANTQLMNLFLNQQSSLIVVNLRTFSGNTALHIVCALENCKGQVEAVKMLIRRGADPGARNFENELPCQLVPDGATGEKVREILKGRYIHVK